MLRDHGKRLRLIAVDHAVAVRVGLLEPLGHAAARAVAVGGDGGKRGRRRDGESG
jgi:hypothetical protein